ncbi:MAG: UPF0182 family protein [Candidatus Limnocylindria bacterium]
MREGRGGDEGGRDWGNIDWSNIDLSPFGRRRRGRGPRPPSRAQLLIALVVAAALLVPLFFGPLLVFLTDLLWFRSVGFEQVFLRRYSAAFAAFVVFFLAFFLLAVPNLYFALRPQVPRVVVDAERPRARPLATTARLLPLLLLPALFFGILGAAQWDPLLRWLHASPFGATDPIFGHDIGFYFFTLPVLEFLRGWLFFATLVIAIGALTIYVLRGVVGIATAPLVRGDLMVGARSALTLARPARAHLSILGGIFLALIAAGYFLDRYELLFRDEGVLTGAGYTSLNARLPALTLLTVVVSIASIGALANAFARTLWVLVGAIGLWLATAVLAAGVYPAVIETFFVRPDQLNRERPYLERTIAATRAAYGLADVDESVVDVQPNPDPQEVLRQFSDVGAVRLWDYRPLLDTFRQLQVLRQFYTFWDVDVDRYTAERPVMLSARELDPSRLPREAQTWVNLHLFYTHGYGAVMTEVGGVTPEGLPRLVLRDIPPQGEPRIDQPRIYYGELTADYVIVGTTQDEHDPQEGRDGTTRFTGGGGVSVGSLWDRILFAIRFGDLNLLISTQVGSESRVLFNRQIDRRVELIAPFLDFDYDPYLVIADGKMYWMHDAYTTGGRYPYSHRLGTVRRDGQDVAESGLNYIRNSVKVVTDAYDGSVTFYVVDESDPIIRTLRAIYPTLFDKTIQDMPEPLREHVRYPEDLFRIQTEIFSVYHMTDPDEFYNRSDAWKLATEVFGQGGRPQPIEPYYVTALLPGSTRPEFVLFVPMTPAGIDRDNMVGWIAGRADPPDYGKVRVLRFPRDRVIFGPLQIEARIEADSSIRQQLTLLGGGGASVTRGNLLVLPAGDSFLYVKPLFVQATQGRIPELKRVILATQDRVVMEDTFERALARLFGEAPPPAAGQPPFVQPPPPPAQATPTPRPTPSTEIAALVREASEQYQRAQDALRAGDFAAYGLQIRSLEETLAKLRTATGQ